MKNKETPAQIVGALSAKDKAILDGILKVEKKYLHHKEIKANSRIERDILDELAHILNREVP